jgi:nodulation protein E
MTANWVEVTGRGVVSSAGFTVPDFTQTILSGQCLIGDISDVAADIRFTRGAAIRNFDAAAHFDERTLGSLDRFSQFAAVAARGALAEAGLHAGTLPEAGTNPERIAVIVGTANGGGDVLMEGYGRLYKEHRKPRPLTIPMSMASAPASRIAKELGARGPVFGVSSACASSNHAIITGMMLIRAGMIDVAVVGGTDSCFYESYLQVWDVLRAVSSETCRPFSTGRKGLIIGEGAGILVLERAGRAEARGAKVIARLAGGGMSSDAGDLIAPDSSGMARAMSAALVDAGLQADAVGYVNAHGTGTVANDRAESGAINEIFGGNRDRISVSSTKSIIGHAMGASGALEAIATLAALETGMIPPTVNFISADPDCDVDATPNEARKRAVDVAMSNSFAFGGLNVSLAFAQPAFKL